MVHYKRLEASWPPSLSIDLEDAPMQKIRKTTKVNVLKRLPSHLDLLKGFLKKDSVFTAVTGTL